MPAPPHSLPSEPLQDLPPAIARAVAHIGLHLGEPLPLQDMAAIAGMSIWQFATAFRQALGVSPHRYICARRVAHSQVLLRQGMPAVDVASATGFCDQSHFTRHFKNAFGVTPGQYRADKSRSG